MDKWAPLEPVKAPGGNKRFSLNSAISSVTASRSSYAPASSGSLGFANLGSPGSVNSSSRYDEPGSSNGRGAERGTTTLINDAYPVGRLPSNVAHRILSFVTLPTLVSCAAASRNFCRVAADESVWKERQEALDWHHVDGLRDPLEISEAQAEEAREQHANVQAEQEAAYTEGVNIPQNEAKSSGLKTPLYACVQVASSDDDFGDFTAAVGNAAGNDSFSEFLPANTPSRAMGKSFGGGSGSSLANRFSSVSIAGQNGHIQTLAHPPGSARLVPSFTPLTPNPNSKFSSQPKTAPANRAVFSFNAESQLPQFLESRSYRMFRARVKQMRPYIVSFLSNTSPTHSLLFTEAVMGLTSQPALLGNILRFVSAPCLGTSLPIADKLWPKLTDAASYLHGILLPAFEGAEARRADAVRAGKLSGAEHTKRAVERAEKDMKQHAGAIWQLGQALEAGNPGEQFLDLEARLDGSAPHSAEGNMFVISGSPPRAGIGSRSTPLENISISAAQVFLEKRDIFEGRMNYNPSDNFVGQGPNVRLDFTPMDRFMSDVLETVRTDGSLIARVFPPEQDVVLAFADRVAGEVIADYVAPLLDQAKSNSVHTYVRACAATFAQALRLADALQEVQPTSPQLSKDRCEDVVYRVWEPNMDEYLRQERQWVKSQMSEVCESWTCSVKNEAVATQVDAAFLASHNPAAVKRNFLTGFKDVLLAPVVVVPRAAVYVGGAAIRSAGTGLAQLNPMRWQSGSASAKGTGTPLADSQPSTPNPHQTDWVSGSGLSEKGYVAFSADGVPMTTNGKEEADGLDEKCPSAFDVSGDGWKVATAPSKLEPYSKRSSTIGSDRGSRVGTPQPGGGSKARFARMQLLLSLDTALQLIQINRDCLRRIETFANYPDEFGHRVKQEIDDISMSVFQYLGEHHVVSGFQEAKKQIEEWKPAEHEQDPETHVAPLVHFFELTHVGDTIQQMVQVYYDQELSRHIDRTDFLNPVVREKKRFEAALDENVASGLNAGVDLLMGQVEHIITTMQNPRDYYPLPGSDMDLGSPTRACAECVRCLRTHCKMLAGSTDKNVLEVFYQEVGLRLYSIIAKHLKRQIISLEGGFKVIADINAYHAFIASLKQPSVVVLFDGLKMLGNIYIIDCSKESGGKELGTIIRDANMFSGTLSPEDLYEFLHARCDFKSIESVIDKELYGFKVREDCIVS
ncbi:hypothetical protein K437DRAFT_241668 [Tilletiaria anomala UBC 951]|uniref:F-box domain-containing protein n=1 Tax=Tilletiaria anomala (strain ATCC 24038 / CBS 436.72 / UBC 951) TaxID=1037660 RepID=A0A066WLM6_TILAU|nr:uncharacterized protein K437DRAFT_241668 [Tilletiaria anomala UBC 951]KDN53498.1 hypothetical protein K437DRAFT_241668 [Tilletiaria anomala UBC 951]